MSFIRVGSYKKNLKDFPDKERELWRIFDQTPFEDGIALERATEEEVLRLIDYPSYFDLLERPLSENRNGILAALEDDRLITRSDAGGWNITNPGEPLVDTERFVDTPPRSRNEALVRSVGSLSALWRGANVVAEFASMLESRAPVARFHSAM